MNDQNNYEPFEIEEERAKLTRIPTLKTQKTAMDKFGNIAKFLFTENSKLGQGISLQNVLEQEFYFQKHQVNTLLQAIFSLIIILSGVAEYEIFINDSKSKENHEIARVFCLWMSFASTLGLLLTIIFEYYIENTLLYFNNDLKQTIWEKQPKRILEIVAIMLVLFLHPNPVFYGISVSISHSKWKMNSPISSDYSFNGLLSVYNLFKFYYISKYYLMTTNFYTTRAQRICEINNFDTSLFFSLKAHMVQKPIETYIYFFITIVACLSYALRFFERELIEKTGVNFDLYANNIWCLIITMSTVGYGDFYPSSDAGRLIGIIVCIVTGQS